MQLLKSLLASQSINKAKECTAYVATALRNAATLQLFLDQAAASKLTVEDMSVHARHSCVQFQHHLGLKSRRDQIFVHMIKRKS